MFGGAGGDGYGVAAEEGEQFLDGAAHIAQSMFRIGLDIAEQRHAVAFTDPVALACVGCGDFVEPDVGVSGVLIGFSAGEEAWHERGTEHGFGFATLVVDQQRFFVSGQERLAQRGADEAEADGLVIAVGGQDLSDFLSGGDLGLNGLSLDMDAIADSEVVIAVNAGDFLDEVDFAFEVEAESGDLTGDFVFIVGEGWLQIEPSQDVEHAVGGDVEAEDRMTSRDAHADLMSRRRIDPEANHAFCN